LSVYNPCLFFPPSLTILLPVSKLVLLEIVSLLLPDDECSNFKTYLVLSVHPVSQIGLVPSWLSDLVDMGWFLFWIRLITYVIFFVWQVFFLERLSYMIHVWFFSPSLFILLILLLLPGDEHTYYKENGLFADIFTFVTWNYIIKFNIIW
jgi:hypothetical protein